jgi:hypothetical protein
MYITKSVQEDKEYSGRRKMVMVVLKHNHPIGDGHSSNNEQARLKCSPRQNFVRFVSG